MPYREMNFSRRRLLCPASDFFNNIRPQPVIRGALVERQLMAHAG
jgi:hypothetical protein